MGADEQTWSTEDVAYVCDLGLVAQDAAGMPRIANPIYAEDAVTEGPRRHSRGGGPCPGTGRFFSREVPRMMRRYSRRGLRSWWETR